jgi:hypothetical protein
MAAACGRAHRLTRYGLVQCWPVCRWLQLCSACISQNQSLREGQEGHGEFCPRPIGGHSCVAPLTLSTRQRPKDGSEDKGCQHRVCQCASTLASLSSGCEQGMAGAGQSQVARRQVGGRCKHIFAAAAWDGSPTPYLTCNVASRNAMCATTLVSVGPRSHSTAALTTTDPKAGGGSEGFK